MMFRRGAFTLVELLVAMAILSILAACLLPSVERGLSDARCLVCSNTLRGLGVATISYADDERGSLPISNIWHAWWAADYAYNRNAWNAPSERDGLTAAQVLKGQNLALLMWSGHMTDPGGFFCAEDASAQTLGNWQTAANKGAQWPLLTGAGDVRYSYILNPYGVAYMFNSAAAYWGVAHHTFPKITRFPDTRPLCLDSVRQTGRHGEDTWNMLSADGHVSTRTSDAAGDRFRLYMAVGQTDNAYQSTMKILSALDTPVTGGNAAFLHSEKPCFCGKNW